ncbi:MAG TPA: hypothetical protein DCR07_06465 [Lactococcus sp.]|nr:hypothetical protein [Lactococcus sp.]
MEIETLLEVKPETIKMRSFTLGEKRYNQLACAYTSYIGLLAMQSHDREENDTLWEEVLEQLKSDRHYYYYEASRKRIWERLHVKLGEASDNATQREHVRLVDKAMKEQYCVMWDTLNLYYEHNGCRNEEMGDGIEGLLDTYFRNIELKKEIAAIQSEIDERDKLIAERKAEAEKRKKNSLFGRIRAMFG